MSFSSLLSQIRSPKELSFKRAETIYRQGEHPEYVYFIQQGLVGLFHITESGKESFLRVFGVDAILGHRSFFANEAYHANALALAPTKLIGVSRSECEQLCCENGAILKEVTAQLAKDLGAAELRLAGLQDKSANRRIAESLIYLKSRYPEQVWTRKEIAEYAGSSFETVTRVMGNLEERGLLKKAGRDFQLVDFQRILALTDDQLKEV